MEKRIPKNYVFSSKNHVLYESYKAGCAWSWIQIFNLRPNSNQKLISEKKHAIDKGKRPTQGKLTLQDYIEEEKFKEQYRKKKVTSAQVQSVPESPEKHREKSLASPSPKRRNHVRKKNTNMNEAMEEFINRKLIDAKKNKSRDFIDALQVLNSNKELFVKLLQDPNSLLVKHIEELRQSQAVKQKTQPLSEADKIIVLKPKKFEKGSDEDSKSETTSENEKNWLHSYNGAKTRFLPCSSFPTLSGDSLRTFTETTKFLDSLLNKEDDILDTKGSTLRETSLVDNVLGLDLSLENEADGIKLEHFSQQEQQEVVEDDTARSRPSTGTHLDLETDFQEKDGSLSEYISAILQVSCPDWDKLAMKCQISETILDPFLSEAIPARFSLCFGDPRLVISYVNELLCQLHQFHSRSYPWTPHLKPKHRNLVQEVLKHVDWQLLSKLAKENPDHVAENELRNSGNWIDTRIYAEDIVVEIVDEFLDELMVETVFCMQT